VIIVKDAAEGRFGALAARDFELLGGEQLAPLRIGLDHLGHFDGLGQFSIGPHQAHLDHACIDGRSGGIGAEQDSSDQGGSGYQDGALADSDEKISSIHG
jgi:hypothetical protein